ncbi:MAG TPA: LysM domain-containing protein [Lacunisphaera sp.]|nr:LysM domain-containing protein [Lacunisphaera sp.]
MDTLSRDSNSSGSVLPLVGVIAGALGLILAIVALVKLSTLQKSVTVQGDEIAKISTLENDLRAATTKSENDLRGLREGVQNALTEVGTQIGTLRAQVAKVEEVQKARPVAPAAAPGTKAAAAPTGVLNSDGTYSIAPGDTLAKVARKFAVKLDAIEAENPGLDPTKLKVGQKIRIPRK